VKRILFIFLDGIGIGPEGGQNLFGSEDLKGFNTLAAGHSWTEEDFKAVSTSNHVVRSIDANLGIPGLPQSGTGQATIFSGVNCAQLAGRHYGPYPHSTSRPILATDNVYHKVARIRGAHSSRFLNAYPDQFFERAKQRDRWSVTTRCCLDAQMHISSLDDLESGMAIAADFTGAGLQRFVKRDLTIIDEKQAATRMSDLAQMQSLSVFEYFHSDKAGHAQDHTQAKSVLGLLDRFFQALIQTINFSNTTLVITSDHGNLEDVSVKTHTRNPVPLIAMGPSAYAFDAVRDLSGITPAILRGLHPTE